VDVRRAKRNASLAAGASVIAAAVVGYAAFEFADHAGFTGQAHVTRQEENQNPPSNSGAPAPSQSSPETTASPSVTASPSSSQSPVQGTALSAVAVEAFGPNGTSDGDNPQGAANVLTRPAVGWQTQWYATPLFGQLKHGTGLLIDMGRAVTVTQVQVRLGTGPGADLELRSSTRPQQAPSGFQTRATLTDVSGTANFTFATPAQARYILLWCTRLPRNPNSNGSYALVVRHVAAVGQP
jgi:hypothetical protein